MSDRTRFIEKLRRAITLRVKLKESAVGLDGPAELELEGLTREFELLGGDEILERITSPQARKLLGHTLVRGH